MTTALWILVTAIALGAGWVIGSRRKKPNPLISPLERLTADIEAGHAEAPGDDPEEVERLRAGLAKAWTPLNTEREAALRQSLGRVAAYLEESVQGPLEQVQTGDEELLREGVGRALGGLRDLEFFLREPLTPDETHNLVTLVQQAVRDFIADWEVGVRFAAPAFPVNGHIHRDTFMDAVYLLLHNAGHFSGWETVDVEVDRDGERVKVVIRDRGPGFSDEALERARDLFYTTKPSGLGLGIPFARKIIEGFGGQLEIRNRPEGGAEVGLVLPGA
jgi:signal transduction histidine kinase